MRTAPKLKHCFECGNPFRPVRSDQIYCKKLCRLKHYKYIKQAIAKDKQ